MALGTDAVYAVWAHSVVHLASQVQPVATPTRPQTIVAAQ